MNTGKYQQSLNNNNDSRVSKIGLTSEKLYNSNFF
jgi:hypothetical protein